MEKNKREKIHELVDQIIDLSENNSNLNKINISLDAISNKLNSEIKK